MFIGNIEKEKIEFGRGPDKKKRKKRGMGKKVGAALAGAAALGVGAAALRKNRTGAMRNASAGAIGNRLRGAKQLAGSIARSPRAAAIAAEAKGRQTLKKAGSKLNSAALKTASAAGRATGSAKNIAGDIKRASGVGQKSTSLNRRFGKSRLDSAKVGLKDARRSFKNNRAKRKKITG